jgi:membrane dipeptidase
VATTSVGFDDPRDFPNITRGLVGRRYTDQQIEGILGENFLRVFEAVCG